MNTRVITMDQWPDWNRKIFVDSISAAVIGINRNHPSYNSAVAYLRHLNSDAPLLIVNTKDYRKIFHDAENYEDPPCIQVFSHGQNTGHYAVDELIKHPSLTVDFIKDDLS